MIFLELFWTFFKIGAFTFGGGYAMLPLIQSEVLSHGWITSEELIDFIAVSESSPGPFAVNIATYIGSEIGSTVMGNSVIAGIFGSFCATLGVVLPSFIIILLIAKFFMRFKEYFVIRGIMSGLKPAVVGLLAAAWINVAQTVFFSSGLSFTVFSTSAFWISLVLFAVMAVAAFLKTHPIIIICASAAVGIAAGYIFQLEI